jgi:RimJ/RimL family protein N-acetyltransferase
VEIGSTWYTPDVWGTRVNPECKLLLLAHAFDALGMNRVSLCTDARNARSQAAIEKLGAVKEGVLRSHMVTQGGRIRDSVLYSIVIEEWPEVKARLAARLAGSDCPT